MDILAERGMQITPENEKTVREELRREHGMGAFAIKSIETIRRYAAQSNKVFIDGLYSWDEYKILADEFGSSIKLVYIAVNKKIRYERLSKREPRRLSETEAMQRDIAEIENSAKGGPIAFADAVVLNNGSKEEFIAAFADVIEQI